MAVGHVLRYCMAMFAPHPDLPPPAGEGTFSLPCASAGEGRGWGDARRSRRTIVSSGLVLLSKTLSATNYRTEPRTCKFTDDIVSLKPREPAPDITALMVVWPRIN